MAGDTLKYGSLYKLGPTLSDDRLLRIGSRLCEVALPESQRYPIILPKIIPWSNHIMIHLGTPAGNMFFPLYGNNSGWYLDDKQSDIFYSGASRVGETVLNSNTVDGSLPSY